jgi:hypothetical protein
LKINGGGLPENIEKDTQKQIGFDKKGSG